MLNIVCLVIHGGDPFRITGVKAPFAFVRGEPIPRLSFLRLANGGVVCK